MPMRRSAGEIKPRWVPLSVRRDFFENLFQGGLRFPVPFLLRAVAIEHNPREIERSLKSHAGRLSISLALRTSPWRNVMPISWSACLFDSLPATAEIIESDDLDPARLLAQFGRNGATNETTGAG